MFEWSYWKLRRFRVENDERDEQFPSFRRHDAKDWSRLRLMPGSLLVFTRFLLFIINLLFLAIVIKMLCIGHNFKKGPIPDGCRKKCISFMYKMCCPLALFLSGMSYNTVRQDDVDYSYYLGDNYRDEYRDIKKTSTIVCNHMSWLDCIILICHCRPAFAPDAAFRKAPLFNTTIECLDSIYINRGADIS